MSKEHPQQISQDFFDSCNNLQTIQEAFRLDDIEEQCRIRDLQSEFELIRALTQTKKHRMRLRSNTVFQNKKNRYPEQAIYEHSRVLLQNLDTLEKHQEGYINANQIPNILNEVGQSYKVILTQGPTDNTVEDFKKMLQQEKIECVVMLCRLIQGGKSRCSDYIGNCKQDYEQKFSDYITVKKINLGEQYNNHSYHHVYYSEWPDKKVPSELSHIIDLIELIKKYKNIVIHCSAGLGRSGVIAALLLISRSNLFLQQNKFSIFQAVRRLREYRFGAVQNSQQYSFLYSFFKDYSKRAFLNENFF